MSIQPGSLDLARLSQLAAGVGRQLSALSALRPAAVASAAAVSAPLTPAAAQFVAQFDAAAADGVLSQAELQTLNMAALQLRPRDLAQAVTIFAADGRLALWMQDIDRHQFPAQQTGLDAQDRMALFRHLVASGNDGALVAMFRALPQWEGMFVSALRGEFLTAFGQANWSDGAAQALVEAMAGEARHDRWLQGQIATLVGAMRTTPSLDWLIAVAGLDPSLPLALELIEAKLRDVAPARLQEWLFGEPGRASGAAFEHLIEAMGWAFFEIDSAWSGAPPEHFIAPSVADLVDRIVPALDAEALGRFWAGIGAATWGYRYLGARAADAVSARLAGNPDELVPFLEQLWRSDARGWGLHRLLELTTTAGHAGRVRAMLETLTVPMQEGRANDRDHWRVGYFHGSMLIALERMVRDSGPATLAQAAVSIGDGVLAMAWAFVKLPPLVKGAAGYHRSMGLTGPFQNRLDAILADFANDQAGRLNASLVVLGYDLAPVIGAGGLPAADAPTWSYIMVSGMAAAFGFDPAAPFGGR